MTIQEKFILKYGDPSKDQKTFEKKFMTVYTYPDIIQRAIPTLGKTLYCNKDFVQIYQAFLLLLFQRNLHTEIVTNDECFNVRMIRGSKSILSIHSWGMAVDINSKDNPLGMDRRACLDKGLKPFSIGFITTAIQVGLVAGYNFKIKDGMHFEHTKIV